MFKNYYPKYKILKKLNQHNEILVTDFYNFFYKKGHFNPPLNAITSVLLKSIDENLIEKDSEKLNNSKIKITPSGKEYLQNTFDKAALFWIPYVITTVIAITALIVSASVSLQPGCPNSPKTPIPCDHQSPYSHNE